MFASEVAALRLIGWWVMFSVAGAAAGAQDTSRVAPGDGVRVTAPSRDWKRWTGYFVGFRGDSVVLRGAPPDTVEHVVPFAAVKAFEVNHGNQPPRSWVLEGMAVGALFGLSYGAASAVIYSCDEEGDWLCDPVNWVGSFVLFGAATGAITGAVQRMPPYRTVKLESHAAVVPLPGDRVGLGFQFHLRR